MAAMIPVALRWIRVLGPLYGRPSVVTLCGSTRFAAKFNELAEELTLAGIIVLRPEVVTYDAAKDPQKIAPDVKAKLDELHLRKIDLSDHVFVVNVGGYIGSSTQREIIYALKRGVSVHYLEPDDDANLPVPTE